MTPAAVPTGALPTPPPSRLRQLVWFDLTVGQPLAVRLLARHLGVRRLLVLLPHLLRRSLRDPLRGVPRTGWPTGAERQTRRQLRPVLALHSALVDLGLPDDEALAVVGDVVAQVGARFIGANVEQPTPDAWRAAAPAERDRYVRGVVGRLFNARVGEPEVAEDRLGFDVTACRFAHLCAEVGRPELAPLFCAADGAHFEQPGLPIRLHRTGTIATGAPVCDFRFTVGDG